MANFTTNSETPIGLQANPKRADQTAGTLPKPPVWTMSPADGSMGNFAPQFAGGGSRITYTPKLGVAGTANFTVTDQDENGQAVNGSATVTVVVDMNPTITLDVVQIPPG